MPGPSASRPSNRYTPSRKNSEAAGSRATATRSRWPARSAASRIASIASSEEPRSGAKPPSSPTAVASPCSCRSACSEWKTSAPIRSASAKLSAPAGTSMNSWRSIEFCAWTRPWTRRRALPPSPAPPPRARRPPRRSGSRASRGPTGPARPRSAQRLLGSIEVAVLLLEPELGEGLAVLRGEPLGTLDPGDETVRDQPQRELRVDVQPACDVDAGEEHVPDLLEHV